MFDQWALRSFTLFPFFSNPPSVNPVASLISPSSASQFSSLLISQPYIVANPPSPPQKESSLAEASSSLFLPFRAPCVSTVLPLYPTGSASASTAAAATLQQSGRMIKKVHHNPSSFSSLPPIFTRASFTFYAKLRRALCTISSFSSLIPTLVHALMTLKAKGCFF